MATIFEKLKIISTCGICGASIKYETPHNVHDTVDWSIQYLKDKGWMMKKDLLCVCNKCEKMKNYTLECMKQKELPSKPIEDDGRCSEDIMIEISALDSLILSHESMLMWFPEDLALKLSTNQLRERKKELYIELAHSCI